MYFGDKALRCLFIVVNGNLYIDFYEAIFKLWLIYCLIVSTTMSAVLFVAINFSSSFSAEQTENGEIAAQEILACVAIHIHMCVPIDGITFVSHVLVLVRGLKMLNKNVLQEPISKLAPCLPAHMTPGPGGSLKYLNLAKRLRPIIASVRTSLKRFFSCTSSFSSQFYYCIVLL